MKVSYPTLFKTFGVVLWIYILAQLDFAKLWTIVRSLNPGWFLAASAFLLGMFVFKAMRWNTVLALQNIRYSLFRAMGISFVSSFFGLLVPGKMGDVIKLTYVKTSGLSIARGLVGIILDRIYDVCVLLLVSVCGLVWFAEIVSLDIAQIAFVVCIAAVVGLSVVAVRGRIRMWVVRLLKLILSPSSSQVIIDEWDTFKTEFQAIAMKSVLPMALFSILSYLFMFAQFFALARSLGLDVPFLYLGLSLSVATLVSLLPVSVGGLGTREAVFIILLGRVSISPESAVILSFIDLVVFTVLVPAIFTLPFWLKRST